MWNSIVSVAGGWFALIFCETFTMGDRNFQLPGLGSYIQTATYAGDVRALLAGIATVILIVVATDQLVWRPLIAWSDKFKFEQVESADQVTSPILELLRRSKLCQTLPGRIWNRVEEPIYRRMAQTKECRVVRPLDETEIRQSLSGSLGCWHVAGAMAVCWAAAQAIVHAQDRDLARPAPAARRRRRNISSRQRRAAHLRRVDDSRRRRHRPQSQAGARRAAPRADPGLGAGHSVLSDSAHGPGAESAADWASGPIALMLLGTQWYILFNVIAGAMSIPSDLREVASLFHFTRWQRWTRLILPGIFPYLITGMVTASGGAWNASVMAEYSHVKDHTLADHRPGRADRRRHRQRPFRHAAAGHHPDLAHGGHHEPAGMARLYRLAETRYKLEG